MDKYEYGIKLEQIEKLIAKKDFVTAAKIADGIDWRREKSVETLFMIADIYEETERLEDCYEILNMVYDRSATGRRAVYRLTQIATKRHDFEEAIELYKEYAEIAPNDLSRYLLKYQICRESGASAEEQIRILEEYIRNEYDEKWAYELACLYEEAGRFPQCIETCDRLILWFGEGEYVKKALELKMKYQDLTAAQQAKYEKCLKQQEEELLQQETEAEDQLQEEHGEMETVTETEDGADDTPQISVINTNKFSTLNLQEELAKGVRGIFEQETKGTEAETEQTFDEAQRIEAESEENVEEPENEETASEETVRDTENAETVPEENIKDTENVEIDTEETTSEEEKVETVLEETISEIETGIEEKIYGFEGTEGNTSFETVAEKEVSADNPENQLDLNVSDEEFLNKRITGSLTIGEIVAAWEAKKHMAKELEETMPKEQGKPAVSVETGEISSLLEDFIPSTPKETKREELFEEQEEPLEELAEERSTDSDEEKAEDLEELPEIDLSFLEEEKTEEATETKDLKEEPETIKVVFEEELFEQAEDTEGIEDDLPEDIEDAELIFEEESLLLPEEDPEKKEESEDEETISQNTAAMLDAIEKALAQEISQTETSKKHLTEEQEKIFTYFMMVSGMKKQLLKLLEEDKAYAGKTDSSEGNLIITGHPGNGKTTLAIDIVRAFQKQRHAGKGKIAKVTGDKMNRKEIAEVIQKSCGGALIIERAGGMNAVTVEKLLMAMENETGGLLVILEDSKEEIDRMISEKPGIAQKFNRSVNIPIFSNNELVSFGKAYAEENEYYFDELAVLALYDCIGVRQTSDHVVNVAEVKEILDEAMAHADKKSRGFFARLSKKRIDEYGHKLLLEEDFEF